MDVHGRPPWPEFPHLTTAAIDDARRRLAIPDEWGVELCANRCGDVVFVPPGIPELAGVLAACSAECALAIGITRSQE
jgi:hypothetical protein